MLSNKYVTDVPTGGINTKILVGAIAMILVRTIGIYVTFAMLNKKAKMEIVAA